MDQKENLIDKDLSLVVVLPGGVEKMTTVHGSKPLIDLLVMLCAKHHLNPSSHTLELVTSNRNHIKFKPNAIIGALDAEKIILKPKGSDDKNKKTGPQMPEATIRMVINYKKTQKTILRVNPRVPLAELLPAICEKCEFDTDTTVLLRDVQSLAPLDLSCSLNDYAIREIYARDTRSHPASPVFLPSPTYSGPVSPGKDKNQKEKENKGLFRIFRKSKKSQQSTTASAPASPVLVSKPRPLSMALPSTNSSSFFSTASMDMPKKRRAPLPPVHVSQGQTSTIRTRQRIYSEPAVHLHSDLLPDLSGGFSADSSLKRTKRKAPPPPTFPSSVVIKEAVPTDETLQGDTATNTLEEISEQEEATATVPPTALSESQREDGSLNTSADVSLYSKSPDANIFSIRGDEEDQSRGLSSDGNQTQNTVNDSELHNDASTAAGTESSTLGNTGDDGPQVENVCQQPLSEESKPESNDVNGSSACSPPPSVPQPVKQDAEVQISAHAHTETPREPTVRLEIPAATSTSRPTGEDAEVQTDFTPLPVPSQQHPDIAPSPPKAPGFESAGKKDMSTLTEELNPPDLKVALTQTSETSSCQDTPFVHPSTKMTSSYVTNSEPKPKPSNELTRDYIPKAGMTTYTIVPPKSLEKLRYFEVALTLESSAAPLEEGLDVRSPHLEECTSPSGQPKQKLMYSAVSKDDFVISNNTAATPNSVNDRLPEHVNLSPTRIAVNILSSPIKESHPRSPPLGKEMKIPPATKPKPGSFRLAQPKKTAGYYVTSAAEKRFCPSSGTGNKDIQGNLQRAKSPPTPTAPHHQELTGATNEKLSPKDEENHVPNTRVTRQSSLSTKEPRVGLSLEKLRSFAAPRPFSPTTPSRFAQAVSSAVRRSQSLSHCPKSPHSPESPPFSPIPDHSPGSESQRLSPFKDDASTEMIGDKGSTVQEVVGDQSFCANLQTGGDNAL